MDVMDGETCREYMFLWLWRIVIKDQGKMLRPRRILVQDLKQGRSGLTLRKLAFVENDD